MKHRPFIQYGFGVYRAAMAIDDEAKFTRARRTLWPVGPKWKNRLILAVSILVPFLYIVYYVWHTSCGIVFRARRMRAPQRIATKGLTGPRLLLTMPEGSARSVAL